jgi:hypothetical protein
MRSAVSSWARSTVDGGHFRFVMALAGCRGEVVQRLEVLGAELDAVGGGVLPRAGDPPGAGDRGDVLALRQEVTELAADPGLSLIAFTADAGSPDDDALRLLTSWATTHNPAGALPAPDQT